MRPPLARPLRRSAAILLGAGLATALALAFAASAAAAVRIANIDTSGLPSVRLTIVTSKPSLRPPRLTENGRPVADLTAANLGRAKSVVLAVDRSQSMRGRALRDAAAAARRFVALKPQEKRR